MAEFSQGLNEDSFGEWDFIITGEVGVLDVADELAIAAIKKRLYPGDMGGVDAQPSFDTDPVDLA